MAPGGGAKVRKTNARVSKCGPKGTKMAQMELRRGSLGVKVAPRESLEEPRCTQDGPMATPRGPKRPQFAPDGALRGRQRGVCEKLRIDKNTLVFIAKIGIWPSHVGP